MIVQLQNANCKMFVFNLHLAICHFFCHGVHAKARISPNSRGSLAHELPASVER